jgi:putative ABC transport system substrate-binding protein
MRRRAFIAVLARAAAGPLGTRAQQAEQMRRVGVLNAFPENDPVNRASVTAFAGALEHLGWVEGENIRIDYCFAAGDPRLFKTYAAELVGLSPDEILASDTPAVAASASGGPGQCAVVVAVDARFRVAKAGMTRTGS